MDPYKTGTTFAGYTIQGLVAGGGMGQVYAATHEVYTTPVALKVLHPKLHADASWMKRFSVEGLVGTRLKHPHVLSARELVSHNGRIALVMDLVQGGQTLEKVIAREHRDGLGLVQGLKLFLKIVQGIDYLHGKAIVHGDIKPENVLIECTDFRNADTWTPLVTDFGTVGLIADPVMIDGKPAVVATPRYASPEHLFGVDRITEVSDIYALGLVLHFILTGQHPSLAKTVEEAAKFVRNPLSVVALANYGDSTIALYRKACAREPDDRFETARDLALAVRAILDEHGAPLQLGDDLKADLATEIDEEMAERKKEAEASPPSSTQMATEIDHAKVSENATTTKGAAMAPEPEAMPLVDGEGVSPEPKPEPELVPPPSPPAAVAAEPPPEAPATPAPTPEPAPAPTPKAEPTPAPPPAAASRPETPRAPVPADRVDPDGPVPIWLGLVIVGSIGFLLVVAWMAWV